MTVRSIFPLVFAALIVWSPRASAQESPTPPAAPSGPAINPLPHGESSPEAPPAPASPGPSAPAADSVPSPNVPAPWEIPPRPAPLAVSVQPTPVLLPPGAVTGTSPQALLSVAASPTAPRRRRMGWFGVGARWGVSAMHLAPSEALIGRLNQASGQTYAPNDFAVASNAQTLTPTLHFGGSGYFFKLDLPFTFAPEFTTFGLGLYPINVGVFIEQLSLFPYLSIGGVANFVKSRTTADPGTSDKIIGAIVQARAAAGVKYFPVRGLALSGEVGYSPWTAGMMMLPPSDAPGTGSNDQSRMQGGTGSVVDVAMGVEWL